MTIGVDLVVRGSHTDGLVVVKQNGKSTAVRAGHIFHLTLPCEHFDEFTTIELKGDHGRGHGKELEFGYSYILTQEEREVIDKMRSDAG